jgi:hypothetical protein
MNSSTCYIERSSVRELLIGVSDEDKCLAEILLGDVDRLPIFTRPAQLEEKAREMRDAIDAIDLALHGIENREELETLWQDARDDLRIKIEMDVATFRQICAALEECNRIANDENYAPAALTGE